MIVLTILLASSASPCDRIGESRRLLDELQTQEALELVAPMRDDRRCPAAERARAWLLSAEAWFALGEDPSARYCASQAFELDPLSKPERDLPAVLSDLIEDQRKFQVGDTLQPQDRTGTVVDLAQVLPIKVYVPQSEAPMIEVRKGGSWVALTARSVPGAGGHVFGAALPRSMLQMESISYRFVVGETTLGPFQRRTAREQEKKVVKAGWGVWHWTGLGAGVGLGVTAGVLLLSGDDDVCQPMAGTACIQLRVRP